MKKIMIIGSSGSGKSTLARRISEITKIESFHLDRLFWKAGWENISQEEFKVKITKLLELDTWIIDGTFGGTMGIRLEAADTIIFLDFPSWVCLFNVIKRRIMYLGKTRPDMAEGCNEKIDLEFVMYILTFSFRRRKAIYETLNSVVDKKNIFVLKNRKETNLFLLQRSTKDSKEDL